MHILLFGKNGQVGWELQRALAPLGRLTALGHDSDGLCGDFLNPVGIADTVRRLKPNIIVNATGYTAVDRAESERDLATCVNATSVEALAREAQKLGALMLHYSTDYVFNGNGDCPWSEQDCPSPLNFYGKTKLAGEIAIQNNCDRYLIFRSSWIYSVRGHNFIKAMLKLCQERENISVVDDQFGAPTGADLLADCSAHAIRIALQNNKRQGIYHLAASGVTSWYEYANFIIEYARKRGFKFKVEGVTPIHSSLFPQSVKRPLNSRLDTNKFQHDFGLTLPFWKNGVERMIAEYFTNDK